MLFARAGLWPCDDIDLRALRRNFWRKLMRSLVRIPFAEDLLAAYYCAFDHDTPLHVKGALVGALAYFVLPTDSIPDFLPVVGLTDDAAVLAATLKLVADHMRRRHRMAARKVLDRLANR